MIQSWQHESFCRSRHGQLALACWTAGRNALMPPSVLSMAHPSYYYHRTITKVARVELVLRSYLGTHATPASTCLFDTYLPKNYGHPAAAGHTSIKVSTDCTNAKNVAGNKPTAAVDALRCCCWPYLSSDRTRAQEEGSGLAQLVCTLPDDNQQDRVCLMHVGRNISAIWPACACMLPVLTAVPTERLVAARSRCC